MKVAIYTRAQCSNDNEREENLKKQINSCMRYAELKNFVVDSDHIYTDSETFGTQRDRMGLNKLLQGARARLFDAILVEEFSRFSRDAIKLLMMVKELKDLGISLHAVEGSLDTNDDKTRLNLELRAIVREVFLDNKKMEIIQGQLEKKKIRGFFLYEECFGYKTVPKGKIIKDKKGRSKPEGYEMVIVPHQAALVMRIFQTYANGKSISGITGDLNKECVPGIMNVKHRWSATTVRTILKNTKYIGNWSWGVSKNTRNPITGKIQQVPRPEGPLFEAKYDHLQIVPKNLWEQVQSKL